MRTIRSRLIAIGGLLALAVWQLIPTDVTQRVRDATTGRMKDTTIRRVPINLGLDLQGGIHLALEVDQSTGPVPDCATAIQLAEKVVRTRIDEFGTSEPVVQIQGRCRRIVELAGEKDPARAKSIIQRTAFLEFRITDMKNLFRDALPEIDKALRRAGVRAPGQGAAAASVTQLFGTDTAKAKGKAQKGKAAAKDTTDLNAPGPLSSLLFQGQLPGEYLVPEEQVPGQPRIIKSLIGQRGEIELGAKPLQDAQDLALVLKAGALPAPLTIIEERTIGPSLGQDSIRDGIHAGIVEFALVVLIMVVYYRVSGLLAVAALVLYVVFTLGGLAGFGFTLTLPGLAGLVLSVGIAVDANVLIFERIREELQHGKLVRTAVDEGFKHAMSAIIDSNVSTALTAGILYLVGTGPVRGFAITLIIGIGASMITAIFVVRTFYMIWLDRRPYMATLSV